MNKPSRIPSPTTPRQPARESAKPHPPVMQTKLATQQAKTIQPKPKATPAAPPVYRPQPVPKCLQPKMSNAPAPSSSRTSPAHRSQLGPKVLQTKMVHGKGNANKLVLQLAEEKKPKKQALISNYFGGPGPKKFLEDDPDLEMLVIPESIEITGEAPTYVARDQDGRRKLGELELYQDNNGRYWINNINVNQWARGKGVALKLLQKAIANHGTIYASNQDASQDTASDTRHLTEAGYALVRACIKKRMNVVYRSPVT